jgi:hypothetical protein
MHDAQCDVCIRLQMRLAVSGAFGGPAAGSGSAHDRRTQRVVMMMTMVA